MNKKLSKRILAMILSFAVVFSMIPGVVFAAGGSENQNTTATVTFTSQMAGAFLHAPQIDAEVSSDLAESYGYTDDVDQKVAVSALDVLVKAHEIIFGEDFTRETTKNYLDVGSTGFITKIFGAETNNCGFTVNGAQPHNGIYGDGEDGYASGYTVDKSAVYNGDTIEFFVYQDSYALDNYPTIDIIQTDDTTYRINVSGYRINVSGYCIAYDGCKKTEFIKKQTKALENVQLAWVNIDFGATTDIDGAVTDEEGNTTITVDESEETRYLTAYMPAGNIEEDDETPVILPFVKLTPKVIPAYVTIEDSNSGYVTEQLLNVGWFDVRPFMSSGAADYAVNNKITTVHALIEGVYYKLYDKDPTREELNVTADSDLAKEIKSNLDIENGTWGLSQKSVFGNKNLNSSAINNMPCASGIGTQEISANDDIVFYDWTTNLITADILGIKTSVVNYDKKYPQFDIRIKAYEIGYDSNYTLQQLPLEQASITNPKGWDSTYSYGETNANGTASVSFMEAADNGANTLLVKIGKSGLQSSYFRIDYNWNGESVSDIKVSQTVKSDTSLKSFTVNVYGTAADALPYINNNLEFDVDSSVEKAVLNIEANSNEAEITGIEEASGSKITGKEITLNSGVNTISFTVTNGFDKEDYTLKINRKSASVESDITAVIDSVYDTAQTYNADYILGKKAAGKTITDKEKTAFLKTVLNRSDMTSTPGSAAKMILALAAVGIDARQVPVKDSDTSANMVAGVYNADYTKVSYITQLPYVLYLTDSGIYKEGAATARDNVIDQLLKRKNDWTSYGADSAAMIMQALAPYYKNTENGYNGVSSEKCQEIKTAVESAFEYIKSAQQENGTFGNNANTTAAVVEMLAAYGIDPQSNEYTKTATGKNALNSLLIFKNEKNTLGYTSTTYNEFASVAGANAMIAYKEYAAKGTGSIYTFKAKVEPYYSWPDAKIATGLIAIPSKVNYNTGDSISVGDLTVKVVYNNDDSDNKTINRSDYNLTYDFATAGTKKVTVEYKGLTTNYNVTVGDTTENVKTVACTIEGLSKLISESKYVLSDNETVMDVLKAVLSKNGISVSVKNGNYVAAIGGKGEFDEGPNSGWLVRVNGQLITVSAAEYILKSGDVIEWFYTNDWTTVPGVNMGDQNKSQVTTSGTDSKTTTSPTEVKVSGSIATATVTDENAAELVKQAKENKSAEIILNVSSSDTDNAETVNLELTKKTLDSIVNDTDAAVTVKTQTGEINLDKETLKQINSEAAGDVVTIEITRISKPEETHKALIGADGQIYRLTVKSGDSVISQFKGNVTVRLAIPAALKDRAIAAVHIKDGVLEKLDGRRITQDKVEFYEFKTPHFSEFALVDTDQVKLEADDDNADKAKSLVKELKLTAASSKTAKKNVKITVKMNSKNNALIKELKGMGYTVKYKYYRSTKKASKYSAVKTKTAKTYINTKGKKGTKYYYKARVMVYDGDKLVAQSALKQCRYAARVWSK